MSEQPIDSNVGNLGVSPTLGINEESARLEEGGRQIYRLGLGQSPFPVPSAVADALRAHADEKDYLPVQGLPALRREVADHHERTRKRRSSFENVIIGPGSKELIFLCQLVFDGKVLIPSPSWVSYAPQAQIARRSYEWLPTSAEDGWRLTPATLEETCRDGSDEPRLLILNYPNNPTGVTYSTGQLEALAEVARRHGVVVVSDEIYFGLDHDGEHTSIAQFYGEGTIVTGGLSKWCGAGGWRLGTAVFPDEMDWMLEAVCAVASETFTSVSAPIQYAGIEGFRESDEMERYLEATRSIVGELGGDVTRRLRAAGARLPDAEGGFYVFPDFSPLAEELVERGIETSTQLAESVLAETGVAFLPGSAFGRPEEELTARLAYVNFDGDAALKAALDGQRVDEAFLASHCRDTLDAVDALTSWLVTSRPSRP